jgi:hypothetical protein
MPELQEQVVEHLQGAVTKQNAHAYLSMGWHGYRTLVTGLRNPGREWESERDVESQGNRQNEMEGRREGGRREEGSGKGKEKGTRRGREGRGREGEG